MKRIIELALNLVPEGSLTEGRLLTHYGFELGRIDGDYASAQAEFNRALSVARKAENAPLELSILTNSADVDLYHGKLEDCATKNLNAIAQAVRANDAYNEAFARMNYIRALILQGDGREARRQMAHFRTVGERMRDRYWLAGALYDDSWLSCLEGDWQTGSNLAEAALDLSSRHSNAIVSLVMAEYETGNFGQGELYLERLLEVMSLTSPRAQSSHSWPAIVIPYAGLISGVPVRLKEATEAAQIVLSSPSGALLYNVMARSGLGLQAVILDDPDAAAEQYRNLQSIQGRLVPFFWSGDWILALLARTMGNWERAVQHFEDSLLFCQKAGYRPQLARASAYFGETLMQRNLPGDIEKAESLLNEATTLSNELGMQPLMDWIQSCEKKLKDLPSGASDHLYGLTERELQVLRLIVSGKSNAEIAEELIISVRTVANHVANILTKTSTSNRVEAATLATRNHLD